MRTLVWTSAAAVMLAVAGCKHDQPKPTAEPAKAEAPPPPAAPAPPPPEPLPELAPAPAVPAAPAGLQEFTDSADNPTTPEKVALGHILFFDKRISKDDSMACVGCHYADKAWTDDRPVSPKVGGAMNKRNAPTMLNLGFHPLFYWDGRMPTLEAVANAAWKGQLGADPKAVAEKLNALPKYRAHFQRAFKENATADNVPKALAAWFRALKSGNSAWDKMENGDAKAVSKEAKQGFETFKTAGCTLCHVPPMYTDYLFHNVGIGSDKPEAERDHGRTDATKDAANEGQFKTPSLRDVAMTGPYFHDGSVKTLEEAIELMAAGGKKNPHLDEKLKPAKLNKKQKAAIKAFLESLTGEHTFNGPPPEMP
jgi:cytochrome c peroxidase